MQADTLVFILEVRKMIFRGTEEFSMDRQLAYEIDEFNSILYLISKFKYTKYFSQEERILTIII